MRILLVLSLLLAFALSCNPPGSGGTPTNSATFLFNVYPPLTWTFYDSAFTGTKITGPQSSSSSASAQVKKDIDSAIADSIADVGLGGSASASTNYSPIGMKELTEDCLTPKTVADKAFAYYEKSLFYKCLTGAEKQVVSGYATVTASLLLYPNQWDSLAIRVQKKLQTKNVIFESSLNRV